MSVITLKAEARNVGKKGTKAVRKSGGVPCVLYGKAQEPVSFAVPEIDLKDLIYTSEVHKVSVELDGQSWACFMKDIDFHPVTDRPLHADFQVLVPGETVIVTVPVRLVGTPKGQLQGGRTRQVLKEAEIMCTPEHMPSSIKVDVSDLAIRDTIHVRDLSIDGVEFVAHPGQTVVVIASPKGGLAADEEDAEVAAEAEAEAEA